MDYLVDIIVPVYNHEKYIGQAIESMVAQRTSFNYRILLGEDRSTDNSKAVIERYQAMYPGKVFPAYHEKNLGAIGNGAYLLDTAKAKYIAICEGDDYWTDERKLQKQVDFLEANPGFSICFTDVAIADEMGWNKPKEEYFPVLEKDELTIEDIIASYMSLVPTPTILFRNVLPDPLPGFYKESISVDILIQILVADKGKAKYLPDVTAVYRNHSGGITKSNHELIVAADDKRFLLYERLNKYLEYRHDKAFKQQLYGMTKYRMIYGSRNMSLLPKIKNFTANFSNYLKYSERVSPKEIAYIMSVLFFPGLLKMKAKKS